jgi:ABC-type antimicrobial peptide transport system permease subunit
VLVVVVGVFGLTSYRVARRTQEIGLRMALGAHRRDVLTFVARDTLWCVAVGLAIGLALALGVSRWLEGLVFGLSPHDMTTIVVAVALMAMATAVATFLPAKRATRTDPLAALRAE